MHEISRAELPTSSPTLAKIQPLNVTMRNVVLEQDVAHESFVEIYQEAFSGPPYFEAYTSKQVTDEVWNPHIRGRHTVIVAEDVLATDSARFAIGLASGHAVLSEMSPSSRSFMEQHAREGSLPIPLPSSFYISELALLSHYRGFGIGRELVVRLLNCAHEEGFTHWITRTAHQGSHSLKIFLALGADILSENHNIESEGGSSTQSNERIYLYGTLPPRKGL